jgi:1-phosphofructokinase/6-phosphofructokinase 2
MMFDKIITCPLNPCVGHHLLCQQSGAGGENVVQSELYDSAVEKRWMYPAPAKLWDCQYFADRRAGQENSARYFERSRTKNVTTRVHYTEGRIRENISIITPERRCHPHYKEKSED